MPVRELPSLNALRAFEAASRLGSMSLAAGELHVTHGAISRQVRALEEALGQPLFVRQGRGVALTEAGRTLNESCTGAFEQLRNAWTRLQQSHANSAFVLGCSGSVLARWVIPRLERLRRDLPALTLHLSVLAEPAIESMNGVDAVLLLAAPPWPGGWQVHELAAEYIGPVLSPRYPDAERLRELPADALYEEPLLHTASRPQAWPDWARAMGLPAQSLQQAQALPHLYFLLEAAAAGLGVAIAPRPLVADDLAAGRLIAPWGFRATPASWALCAPRQASDPRLVELADWLRRELREK
ncbi:MAG: LysR family transcriptional regulator [Rhodanobacter sp.]|nr:MAG: LysR family transcriptional regulator [Rhodanobacter sp.]TAM02821.1 MAG: LysR family transcriptional regulator [Rhodanobacter sp.]TAM42567.1 MAG: LysR family transcriptional regulator [Rhodanobacter sp.]TAN26224.1 MAG: LysR family transcriptional regulator [Rhodanobacter sp.]